MTLDLDAIESAARAATQEGWNEAVTAGDNRDMGHARSPEHPRPDRMSWHQLTLADAHFLVAAQPKTVLALIAEIRRCHAEIEHANATIEQMAKMARVTGPRPSRPCPHCGSSMVKTPCDVVVSWWRCDPCSYAEVTPFGCLESITFDVTACGDESKP